MSDFDLNGAIDNLELSKTLDAKTSPIPTSSTQKQSGFSNEFKRFLSPIASSDIQRTPNDSGSKYDKGYINQLGLEDYRAENQSAWAHLFEGGARVLGGTLVKAAEGFSVLGSAIGVGVADTFIGANNLLSDDKHQQNYLGLDEITDNPINNVFYGLEDMMKAALPIYKTANWNDKTLLQQMGSTAWWADEGADVLGFALSNFIPAGAIGKLGLGAELAGKLGADLSLAAKATEGASEITASGNGMFSKLATVGDNIGKTGKLGEFANDVLLGKSGLTSPVKFAKNIDALAQNAYMTTSEAYFMTRDAGKSITENYLRQVGKESLDELTPQQQKELTDRKAKGEQYTFWSNMAALSFTSHIEAGFINKIFGHASSDVSGLINAGKTLVDDVAPIERTGVDKFLNATRAGSYVKNIPKFALLEGAYKANIQNAIQTVSTQFGYEGKLDYIKQVLSTAQNNLTDADAIKAMGANLVVGTIMGAMGASREHSEQQHAVVKAVDAINSSKENMVNLNNVLYSKDEQGNIKIDTQGQPIYNIPALTDYAANTKQTQDLADLHDIFKSSGEEHVATILKNEAFSKYALAHLEAGLGDELTAKVKAFAKYNDEDLAKLGYDPIEIDKNGDKISTSQKAQNLLNQVNQIKQDYARVTKTIAPGQQNNARINEAVKVLSRARTLDSVINNLHQDNNSNLATLIKEHPDVAAINNKAIQLQAAKVALFEAVGNGNISQEVFNKQKDIIQKQEQAIIEQKAILHDNLHNQGYEVIPDANPIESDMNKLPEYRSLAENHMDIEDSKMSKQAQLDRYNKITDFKNGENYFNQGIVSAKMNDINQENIKEDETNKAKNELENYGEGDTLEYQNEEGQTTRDKVEKDPETGNLLLGKKNLDEQFIKDNPNIRKLTPSEVQEHEAEVNHKQNLANVQDKIAKLNSKKVALGEEPLLGKTLSKEEVIINKEKGTGRISEKDLQTQLHDIVVAKTRLQDIIQHNQSIGEDTTQQEETLKNLNAASIILEGVFKKAFPNTDINTLTPKEDVQEIQLSKTQAKQVASTLDSLLGEKSSFAKQQGEVNKQLNDLDLQSNKLQNGPIISEQVNNGNPVTVDGSQAKLNASPTPDVAVIGLMKTAGAHLIKGELNDKHSQKTFFKWTEEFDPKIDKGFKLRAVNINDAEYGLNGSTRNLYNEDDPKYHTADNIKVLVVDKKGNPVLKDGEHIHTSLVQILDTQTELEHFKWSNGESMFRNSGSKEQELLAIRDYKNLINQIKQSSKPIFLQILGKSNGIQVKGEPIAAKIAFGKEDFPLQVITDKKTTIGGKDFNLPEGVPVVNYRGRPVGAILRTLTPEENKAVLQKLKDYATNRGNSEAVDNGKNLQQLRSIIFLGERGFDSQNSIFFVKGKNSLSFGDSIISHEDLISGKYDEQLSNFLTNQNHQVDRALLESNQSFTDVFGKQWNTYKDYLLNERVDVLDTPLTFEIAPYSTDINKPQFHNTYLTFDNSLTKAEPVKVQTKAEEPQAKSEAVTELPYVRLSDILGKPNIEVTPDLAKVEENTKEEVKEGDLSTKDQEEADALLRAINGDGLFDDEPIVITKTNSKIEQDKKIEEVINTVITPQDLSDLKEDLKTNDEVEVKQIVKEEIQNIIAGTKSKRTLTDRIKKFLSKVSKHFLAFGVFVNLNLGLKPYEAPIIDASSNKIEFKTSNFDKFNDLTPVAKKVYQSELKNGKPFIIVDKPTATVYIVGKNGERLGSFPAILGTAKGEQPNTAIAGDKTTLDRATTPAGRFSLHTDNDKAYDGRVLVLDNQDGIAIHETFPGQLEARTKALDSSTVEDNRMSWGCINIDAKNFDKYVKGNIGDKSVIIITPDSQKFNLDKDRVKNYTKSNPEDEERWFKENISTTLPYERIKSLIDNGAYGRFEKAGRVLISDLATAGTSYHEGFHVVTQLYLKDGERNELYKNWREENSESKDLSDKEVEEKLAEEFREYMLSDYSDSKNKSIFKKIADFVRNLLGFGQDDKQKLFQQIGDGKFLDSKIQSVANDNLYSVGKAFSASTEKDLFNSMTLALLQNMKNNGFSVKDLTRYGSNLLDTEDAQRFSRLYNIITESMAKGMEEAAKTQSNADLLTNQVIPYVRANRGQIAIDHMKYLGIINDGKAKANFRESLEGENTNQPLEENEKTKDTLGIIDSIQFSAKSGMPNIIKLLIAGLPKTGTDENGNPYVMKNNLGLPSVSDYKRNINILTNELSGFSSLKDQVAKINELRNKIPEFKLLLDQLGVQKDGSLSPSATLDQFDLQAKFRQQFDKNYYNFYLHLHDEDGNSRIIDANTDKLANIVKARWQSNLITNKEAIKSVNGVYVLDKSYFEKNYSKALQGKEKQKSVLSFYKDLGITFSKPELVNIDVLSDRMNVLMKRIQSEDNISDIFDANTSGWMNSLIEQETRTSSDYSDNQHINPEGKTVYNVSLNDYLSQVVNEANTHGFPDNLQWNEETQSGNVAVRNSIWKPLIEKNKNLTTSILEGSRINQQGETGENSARLSTPDVASQHFTAVLSGIFPFMQASDKSLAKGFSFKDVKGIVAPQSVSLDEATTRFSNYLSDEMARSWRLNVQDIGRDFPQYEQYAKNLTIFRDVLNIVDEKTKDRLINRATNLKQAIADIDDFVKTDTVRKSIQDWLASHVDENLQVLLDNNLVTKVGDSYTLLGIPKELATKFVGKDTQLSEGQMKALVEQFTIHYLTSNIEQTKLFTGDVAFYKDFFKRTSGLVGTGKTAWTGSDVNEWLNTNKERSYRDRNGDLVKYDKQSDGKISTWMFKDINTTSSNLEDYVSALKEQGLDEKYARKLLDTYKNYAEADAQSYATLPEYREFLSRTGDWTNSHEAIYEKLRDGERLTSNDLNTFFGYGVLKPQYFGSQKADGINVPTFYKTSLMPLIPSIVKGRQLEELMHRMHETGTGISIFESGSKVGNKEGNNLYDENGKLNIGNDLNQQIIDYKNLKIQLDIDPTTKQKVIFGTQFRKLVLANLANKDLTIGDKVIGGNRLIQAYSDMVNQATAIETKNLIDKLGLSKVDENNYKLTNPQYLRDLLTNEAFNRNAPDDLINGINDVLGDELKPIDVLVNRNKIENILMSLVDNNAIKQKVKGDMRVQGASTGFESGTRTLTTDEAGKQTWWSKVEKVDGSLDSLNFYKYDKTGTKAMEVYLPAYFKEYLGHDVDINKIDPKLLNLVGFRTPTQALNSIELIKIKGFLPQEAGNLVVVPSEIVVKAGSDFDIDKLSLMFPNYTKQEDGSLKYLEYKGNEDNLEAIHNRIYDLATKIVGAPENFKSLISPNSSEAIKSIAKEVESIKGIQLDNERGKVIGWKKNLDTREQFLEGKAGIGQGALHNVHHVLSQIVGLKAKPNVKIFLDHNNTNNQIDFSQERAINNIGNKNSDTILDTLSAFLNSFVDIAKDPFLKSINADTTTAGTYFYLIRAGVPLKQAIMFMNQPIISDYLKAVKTNDSQFLKANKLKAFESDIEKLVRAKYPASELDMTNSSVVDRYKQVLSSERLEENIKKVTSGSKIDNATQRQILTDYLNYKNAGDKLGDLINATTPDTKGTGATMNSAQEALDRLEELKENTIFENVDKFVDDNSLIGGFRKTIAESVKMYKPLFFTEINEAKKQLANIKETLKLSRFADREKALNLAKNDLINYTLQSVQSNGIKLGNLSKDYFFGDNSFAKELAEAKNHPLLKDNLLIRELYPLISKNSSQYASKPEDLDNVKTFNKKTDTNDSNLITEDWKQLYKVSPQLADKAMIFSILQSGLNNSPISYAQFISNEEYIPLAHKLIGMMKEAPDFERFEEKFYKNNYLNDDLVPQQKRWINTANGLIQLADGKTLKVRPPRANERTGEPNGIDRTAYPYLKVWKQTDKVTKTGEWELYANTGEKTANGDTIFERTNRLGDGYNLREWGERSIIASNNIDADPQEGKRTMEENIPSIKKSDILASIKQMQVPNNIKANLMNRLNEATTEEQIGDLLKDIC